MKAKHQRLVLVLVAVLTLLAAVLIAIWALRDSASYFYTPSDIAAKAPEVGKAIRLGGMVSCGSIKTQADGVSVHFLVTDGQGSTKVRYSGLTPDLFVEGSGVVADGHMSADGWFEANQLLAKHDENYVPRELKGMKAEAGKNGKMALNCETKPGPSDASDMSGETGKRTPSGAPAI